MVPHLCRIHNRCWAYFFMVTCRRFHIHRKEARLRGNRHLRILLRPPPPFPPSRRPVFCIDSGHAGALSGFLLCQVEKSYQENGNGRGTLQSILERLDVASAAQGTSSTDQTCLVSYLSIDSTSLPVSVFLSIHVYTPGQI